MRTTLLVLLGVLLIVVTRRWWRRRRYQVRVDSLDAAALQRLVERYTKEHVGED